MRQPRNRSRCANCVETLRSVLSIAYLKTLSFANASMPFRPMR
jgi:hypothetical protein